MQVLYYRALKTTNTGVLSLAADGLNFFSILNIFSSLYFYFIRNFRNAFVAIKYHLLNCEERGRDETYSVGERGSPWRAPFLIGNDSMISMLILV